MKWSQKPSRESVQMATDQITIRVDVEAARAFKSASEEMRRKLEALVSIRLVEATRTSDSLEDVMREISRDARDRGLTPEILRSILDDE